MKVTDLQIQEIAKRTKQKTSVINEVYNKDEHRDKTRSWLAQWFVLGYFGIIIFLIISIPTYNIFVVKIDKVLVLDFQNTFLAITSSIAGLLGFVLGFYFKEGEK